MPEEVTSRAKRILKTLEKNDIAGRPVAEEEREEEELPASVNLLKELKELDVNALTPMQALALLAEWKENCK